MNTVYLSLTGGLGNQLFQIAAAVAIARNDHVVVEWINSRPRLNKMGKPEIADFVLPENVIFHKKKRFNSLSSKSIGFLLRVGVNPKRYENSRIFVSVISFLASTINVPVFGRYVPIVVNRGVGYFPGISLKHGSRQHLVGYFQTYKWIEKSQQEGILKNLSIGVKSPELVQLTEFAASENPLIVHMRFGDYRSEESFGLLTSEYYHESISELCRTVLYKSIWVFSDEIAQAKMYLEGLKINQIRFISDVANSSSQTLEAMRLGKGYVIGNSSFSWWAAKLSYSKDALIIAPAPWFIGQTEPTDLIPLNWIRRKGH